MDKPLTCVYCKHPVVIVADEEADTIPTTLTAKLIHCPQCDAYDWLEAQDFGLDGWDELSDADLINQSIG